jgi:hypothetical protein
MPGACRSAAKPAARREGLHAGEGLAEAPAAREQPSKGLTLELSGGAAVRLNEMLDGCDEVRLGEAVGLDERRTMSNRPPQTSSSES